MRLKENGHWLVLQIVAAKVAGQMLHCAMLKKFVTTVAETEVKLNSTFRNGFWPLQGMIHWAMIRATYLSHNGGKRQLGREIVHKSFINRSV